MHHRLCLKYRNNFTFQPQLCQSIKGRCWEDDKSGRLLQQLKGLGDAMSKKLVASAPPIVNLKDMRQVSLGRLEVSDGVLPALRDGLFTLHRSLN
jgi:hypothetical protein